MAIEIDRTNRLGSYRVGAVRAGWPGTEEPSSVIDIDLDLLTSTIAIHTPLIQKDKLIDLPYSSSTITIHTPLIQKDKVVSLPYVSSGIAIHTPLIQKDKLVDLPYVSSTLTIFDINVHPNKLLAVPHSSSTTIIYMPSIEGGAPPEASDIVSFRLQIQWQAFDRI